MTPDFGNIGVSVYYGKAVGWQFVEGRDFTLMKTDSNALVLNETAVSYMGLRDPVGADGKRLGGLTFGVVGVVKDMVMGSPYQAFGKANAVPVGQPGFRLCEHPTQSGGGRACGYSGDRGCMQDVFACGTFCLYVCR